MRSSAKGGRCMGSADRLLLLLGRRMVTVLLLVAKGANERNMEMEMELHAGVLTSWRLLRARWR